MRFEPGPLRLLTPRNLIPPLIYWGAIGFAAVIALLAKVGWRKGRRIWAKS